MGLGGTRDMFLRYMKETGKLPFLEEGSEFKNWKFASAFEKSLGCSCFPWQIVRQRKGTVGDGPRIWFPLRMSGSSALYRNRAVRGSRNHALSSLFPSLSSIRRLAP